MLIAFWNASTIKIKIFKFKKTKMIVEKKNFKKVLVKLKKKLEFLS